jgi:hypothetical protein
LFSKQSKRLRINLVCVKLLIAGTHAKHNLWSYHMARQHIAREVNPAVDAAVPALSVEETARYQALAETLAEAETSRVNGVSTAKAEAERSIFAANSTLLDRLRDIASEYSDLTAEHFDAYVRKPMSDALIVYGMKMPGPTVAKIKVALLALIHGIEPSEANARNVQKFVNEEARPALIAAGVLPESNVGRKAGTAGTKVKDARRDAALVLCADVKLDAAKVQARVDLLLKATSPGNWLLLDRKLAEIAKLLK